MTKFYPKPAAFEKKNQVAPNSLISNPYISDKAVRLLLMLNAIATSGGDWVPRQSDIQKRLGWGEQKMREAIKECCNKGYMIVRQNRSADEKAKGQYSHNEFEFCLDGSYKNISYIQKNSIQPSQEKPSDIESEPAGVKRDSGVRDSASRGLVVTYDGVVTYEQVVCVDSPPVAASPPLKKSFKATKQDKSQEEAKASAGQDIKEHEQITVTNFRGETTQVSMGDAFTVSIQKRKDFSTQEIRDAFIVLAKYKEPVRDWFGFLEGTILNQRKNKIRNELRKLEKPSEKRKVQEVEEDDKFSIQKPLRRKRL